MELYSVRPKITLLFSSATVTLWNTHIMFGHSHIVTTCMCLDGGLELLMRPSFYNEMKQTAAFSEEAAETD